VQALFSLFFQDELAPEDDRIYLLAWRMVLIGSVTSFFCEPAPTLRGRLVGYPRLTEAFARNMPAHGQHLYARVHSRLLDALLILVAGRCAMACSRWSRCGCGCGCGCVVWSASDVRPQDERCA
jgi:hypothetical protein